jgi:hypothetical protein
MRIRLCPLLRSAWLAPALVLLALLVPRPALAAPPSETASPPSETAAPPVQSPANAAPVATEKICDDGLDNDGDTVYDCGDHDCDAAPACQPDGQSESSSARCHDWVDNDSDGFTDCDDID